MDRYLVLQERPETRLANANAIPFFNICIVTLHGYTIFRVCPKSVVACGKTNIIRYRSVLAGNVKRGADLDHNPRVRPLHH